MHTIRCKMNDVMNKAFSSIKTNYETQVKAFLTNNLVCLDVKTPGVLGFFFLVLFLVFLFFLSGMIFTLPFVFYF